jgi:hypothetical protein
METDDRFQKSETFPAWKRWVTLVASAIVMILPGSIYVTGNISPYIASYYNIPLA